VTNAVAERKADVGVAELSDAVLNDALAFGTLGLVERDLDTGRIAVASTPGFDIRASYGFICLRNRSLSPGTLAFMQAVRDEEGLVAEREARLESIYC
jgi:hypothetical protein